MIIRDGRSKLPEHTTWCDMMRRCYDPKTDKYKHYGGRGIEVCQEWRDSFYKFLSDMGPKPSTDHSIDRIDANGNYEPSNCRWATIQEQQRNRTSNHLITYNGETLCLAEWEDRLGLKRGVICRRLGLGWSEEKAVSTPKGPIFEVTLPSGEKVITKDMTAFCKEHNLNRASVYTRTYTKTPLFGYIFKRIDK